MRARVERYLVWLRFECLREAVMMELELALALPDPGRRPKSCLDVKKRCSAGFGHEGGGEERRGGDDCDDDMPTKRKRLVGWPPVKCAHHSRRYVKVKMEGAAIGRKLDVSIHGSYDDLRRTLDRMFFSANNVQSDRRRPYVVTYEDGEGDWLLVGDVPWEAFAKSVKRLKILSRTN